MTDSQKKELEVLKAFINVCEKHNLRYFGCYGTALGAIRHKGFIPWDDDVDVAMPREDYEKFLKLQNEFEGTPYFIQTFKTDPHYIYNFAKLRDSSTTYIESLLANHRINHGVWIDIFPVDGMSKKIKPIKKFKKKIIYIWMQQYFCFPGGYIKKIKKGTIIKDFLFDLVGILTFIFNPFHLRNKYTEAIMKHNKMEECPLSGSYFGFYFEKEVMPTKIFLEYTKVPFEDIEINVPKDYDGYLKAIYNDYMTPPKKEQQIGHHYDKGIDLSTPYDEYMRAHKI